MVRTTLRERQIGCNTSWTTLVTLVSHRAEASNRWQTDKRKGRHKARFVLFQVASCEIISTKDRVWFQGSPYKVYGGRKDTGTAFSPVLPLSRVNYPHTTAVLSHSSICPGCCGVPASLNESQKDIWGIHLCANVLCNYCNFFRCSQVPQFRHVVK
jgi:hypothetical protein